MHAHRTGWRRRLASAFTERLGLKLAALGFALILWVIVTSKEPTEEIVPVRLTLAFDSARFDLGPLPDVHALIAGEGKEIFALYSTPPVIRREVPVGADSVALTLRPGDVELPPNVAVLVRDVQPHTLHVRLLPRRDSLPR
ncbi:MAG TPA: hypothetical protein VFK16_01160 [Gemmatimonadaceae bacterium]|jgi:hypothetical protein|nr:hypothetical protein [Gemmatimonadaceae bacterium]